MNFIKQLLTIMVIFCVASCSKRTITISTTDPASMVIYLLPLQTEKFDEWKSKLVAFDGENASFDAFHNSFIEAVEVGGATQHQLRNKELKVGVTELGQLFFSFTKEGIFAEIVAPGSLDVKMKLKNLYSESLPVPQPAARITAANTPPTK